MIRVFIETSKKNSVESNFIEKVISIVHPSWTHNRDYQIIHTGGKDNLLNKRNLFEYGDRSLVIFDADSAINGGGFEVRKSELLRLKAKLKVEFDLFLFPNNQSDGDVETLLESIVVEEHQPLLDCFDRYCECVAIKSKQSDCLPAKKARLYACVDSLIPNSRKDILKSLSWFDIEDIKIWDFNSEKLKPLKEFIGQCKR